MSVKFNKKKFSECYNLVEGGDLGEGACSTLFLVTENRMWEEGVEEQTFLCKKIVVDSVKAEMQADNQIETLPLVTDHEGIVTLVEVFDFRKPVPPPVKKPEPVIEEKKSQPQPVVQKKKEPKMEMDPEMQKEMANNHLFGRIAQNDFSSDEDDDEYGAELRQAQRHQNKQQVTRGMNIFKKAQFEHEFEEKEQIKQVQKQEKKFEKQIEERKEEAQILKTTGEVYLVFELYPGEGLDDTLKEFCQDYQLPRQVFFQWALQMSETLKYLHENFYLMHTDLDVRNWFLKEDGDLVLGDFGCAKVLGPFGYTPIGTKIYYDAVHSPEEMKGKNGHTVAQFSFNGDVWQLGRTFKSMCKRGKLDSKPDEIDKALDKLIAKMQIEDRNMRPQTTVIIKELKNLKEKHDVKLQLQRKMNPNLSKQGLQQLRECNEITRWLATMSHQKLQEELAKPQKEQKQGLISRAMDEEQKLEEMDPFAKADAEFGKKKLANWEEEDLRKKQQAKEDAMQDIAKKAKALSGQQESSAKVYKSKSNADQTWEIKTQQHIFCCGAPPKPSKGFIPDMKTIQAMGNAALQKFHLSKVEYQTGAVLTRVSFYFKSGKNEFRSPPRGSYATSKTPDKAITLKHSGHYDVRHIICSFNWYKGNKDMAELCSILAENMHGETVFAIKGKEESHDKVEIDLEFEEKLLSVEVTTDGMQRPVSIQFVIGGYVL